MPTSTSSTRSSSKRTGNTPSSTSTSAPRPTPPRPSPSWRSASRRKISPMKSTGTPAWRRTGSTTGKSTSTPSRWGRSSSSAPCGRTTTTPRAARCSTWSPAWPLAPAPTRPPACAWNSWRSTSPPASTFWTWAAAAAFCPWRLCCWAPSPPWAWISTP